jgi:hypothetical protein
MPTRSSKDHDFATVARRADEIVACWIQTDPLPVRRPVGASAFIAPALSAPACWPAGSACGTLRGARRRRRPARGSYARKSPGWSGSTRDPGGHLRPPKVLRWSTVPTCGSAKRSGGLSDMDTGFSEGLPCMADGSGAVVVPAGNSLPWLTSYGKLAPCRGFAVAARPSCIVVPVAEGSSPSTHPYILRTLIRARAAGSF